MRYFLENKSQLILSGDTFSIKDSIKSLGGKWDARNKYWTVPNSSSSKKSLADMGFLSSSPEINTINTGIDIPADIEVLNAPNVFSVREFTARIARLFEEHLHDQYWICGEITSLKQSSGHVYFELADLDKTSIDNKKTAAIACALWAGKRKMLLEKYPDFAFADGMKVKICIHCEFRQDSSRVSAIVDDFDIAFTMGDLALNRQNIVRELKKRGLYDKNKACVLPSLSTRIALITAHQSRACSDFLDELKKSTFAFSVVLFDSHMQGENTESDVCRAFQDIMSKPENFDCVVLTRGGGSRLDLRWFDSLEISKAIAYCSLPVITAIGHFEDVSIADEVAFLPEKTPTGAARFLVNSIHDTFSKLYQQTLLVSKRLFFRINSEKQFLDKSEQSLIAQTKRKISLEQQKLAGIEQSMRILRASLAKTLERGFAMLRDANNKPIMAMQFMEKNYPTNIWLNLRDGSTQQMVTVEAIVTGVTVSKE